ncbi:hypothetical protein E2C01_019280 [Portunus trituberculatus]|uniref:Uncharacterized protein n=1 Tax=Portunus trituberculatus TaxID=210409 RepID=A0A5B7DYL7_PORTR|nr:hypothetical protein [Portunus trituberculatus]
MHCDAGCPFKRLSTRLLSAALWGIFVGVAGWRRQQQHHQHLQQQQQQQQQVQASRERYWKQALLCDAAPLCRRARSRGRAEVSQAVSPAAGAHQGMPRPPPRSPTLTRRRHAARDGGRARLVV